MKPLLPEIANSENFKHAAESQIKEYAASSSVISQLTDALDSWLSHSNQIISDLHLFIRNCDSDCRTIDVAANLICDIATALKRLELETSFHAQFETKAVIAIRKVLHYVPEKSKEKLELLDKNLELLKAENVKLARSRELFTLLDAFCARDSSWTLMNCEDTLPPLFCSLRAVFICCPLFGKFFPLRFSALIRCALKKIEMLIRETLPTLLSVSALSSPEGTVGVDQAVAGCLAAQSACISFQEEFYKLRISVAEAVTRDFTSVIYQGIDEETIFARLDFFYDRCVIILQLLTVIKKRKNELFVSSGDLCQKILKLDLLSPDDEVITHEELIDAIRAINESPSMRPKDIIERIESRTAQHVSVMKQKESDAMLRAATEAATGRKHQQVLHQQQQRIKERQTQQEELEMQMQQQQSFLMRTSSLTSKTTLTKTHLEEVTTNNTTSSVFTPTAHKSRIGDENETASREWSLQYGDQREQIALLSDRDPYYSVVFAFNPPRILILGIPLKQKQLETLAVRFQDALRSRVLHTAEKIRQNKLATWQITTSSIIRKGHYEKFRSAAEELADARYEAHEKSFQKNTTQVQLAQIHSQMMSGISKTNYSGATSFSANSFSSSPSSSNQYHQQQQQHTNQLQQQQLEVELLQLRRYHVAAAHNAYMLDLPASTVVADDDDTLQSYAVQAVLDCFEQFERSSSSSSTTNAADWSPTKNETDEEHGTGNKTESTGAGSCNSEMASTLAYTDSYGVFWSFFIFRYLPAMPKSRREKRD